MGIMSQDTTRVGTSRLGTNGRLVLSQEIRYTLGLEEGDFIDFDQDMEGRVIVTGRIGSKRLKDQP